MASDILISCAKIAEAMIQEKEEEVVVEERRRISDDHQEVEHKDALLAEDE